MDIQKAHYETPPVFGIGGNRFNIQSSNWTAQKLTKKAEYLLSSFSKEKNLPRIIRIQKTIGMFGKIPQEQQKLFMSNKDEISSQKGDIYKLAIMTGQLKQWSDLGQMKNNPQNYQNLPYFRINYGIAQNQSYIFIFGGKSKIDSGNESLSDKWEYHNDLCIFTPYSSSWSIHRQQSKLLLFPQKRVPLIFCAINENLFLYGGYNQSQIFEDAFIYSDNCWIQLEVKSKQISKILSKLKGTDYCVNNGEIYIFGGYNEQDDTFSDQMHKLKISIDTKSIDFQHIKFQSVSKQQIKLKKPPCARSNHSMIQINKEYCAIIGGICKKSNQSKSMNSTDNNYCALNDIIFYNIKNNYWLRVHPLNGPLFLNGKTLSPKANRQIQTIFVNHSLFILTHNEPQYQSYQGQSQNKYSLIQVQFNQYELLRAEVCRNCVHRNQKQSKQNTFQRKSPFLSNGIFYNLALKIYFPYQAVGLLSDCALYNEATEFSIQICNQKQNEKQVGLQKLPYIQVNFNGKGFSKQQFKILCSHSLDQNQLSKQAPHFIDRMKLGALRLGKTFLLITKDQKQKMRRVFLFSTDSLIIQDYQSQYNYMSYEEYCDGHNSYIQTKQGFYNKNHILKYLKPYKQDPSQIVEYNLQNNDSVLFIFEVNTIWNAKKMTSSELITCKRNYLESKMLSQDQEKQQDICQLKNISKTQFLEEQAKFSLKNDPQISLLAYMSVLYTFQYSQGMNEIQFEREKRQLSKIRVQNSQIRLHNNQFKPYYEHIRELISQQKVQLICDQSYQIDNKISFHFLLCRKKENVEQISNNYGILLYYKNRLINRMDINFGSLFWRQFYSKKYKASKIKNLWPYIGIIRVQKGLQVNLSVNGFENDCYTRKFNNFYKKIFQEHCNKKKQVIIQNVKKDIIIHEIIDSQQDEPNQQRNERENIADNQQKMQEEKQKVQYISNKSEFELINSQSKEASRNAFNNNERIEKDN